MVIEQVVDGLSDIFDSRFILVDAKEVVRVAIKRKS